MENLSEEERREGLMKKLIGLLEEHKELKKQMIEKGLKKPRKPKVKDASGNTVKVKKEDKKEATDEIKNKIAEKLSFLPPPQKKVAEKPKEKPIENVPSPSESIKMEIRERIEEKKPATKQAVLQDEDFEPSTIQEVAQDVAMSYQPIVEETKVNGIKSFLGSYKNKYL
jgi:hypothetical protein